MVQNIDDDGYTFHEIISARGLNGEKTSLPFKGSENQDLQVAPSGPIVEDITSLTEKGGRFNSSYNSKDSNGKMDHNYTNSNTLDYPGFHLNEEKTKQAFETIKADGSTVVPVYMDRNVHTIWVYKNASSTSYYQAKWVNATDENGNIHVDLRYGQSSEKWFDKLNKDYIYYMDKSIGSFYTRAPAMGDKDIYMYRVLAKGTKYQLRFVEWDPSKFNAQINSSNLATLQSTLGTMKEIGKRVSFQNSEWYMNWNGYKYRVYEPYNGNYGQTTYSWVDKTDHVDDIEGFEPKKGDMSRDGLQSVNVNNPAFRDYMFAAGKNVGGYQNYTGTPYMEDGNYVGFLFYIRKSYKINYYSGNDKLSSKSYKYEAEVNDFGLNYEVGKTINPKNSKEIFKGWYKDSTFSVPYTAEDIKTMPAHDTNVYAKWEAVEYKVTFHTNQSNYADGQYIEEVTNIPDSKTIYDGQYKGAKAIEENLPKEVKPNEYAKEFLGWYEKNQYGRYVKANLHKPIRNNNTHLYAKWVYEYLSLKYDLNLASGDSAVGVAPTDKDSYIKDAKAQVKDIGEVTVNGGKKVFVGWSESKDGSTGLIKPSETVLMDKNKTLYAQWKEFPDLATTKVTYDPNGGTGKQYTVENLIVEDFHKVLDNDKDENLKYSREGYVFKGWSRDKDATKAEFQAGEEVNVNQLDQDKNNYIYAIWAPIINYTTDGNGQVKEGENFVDNTKEEVELKTNPKGTETKANEGYKFSNWTANKEITLKDGTKIPAGEKITEDQLKQAVITEPLTFTAHFVQDEFKVKHEFKVADDSPVKEMPADVKTAVDAQLPEDKKAEDGKATTPGELKNPTDVEDKTNDGVWTFEGFKDQDTTTGEVDAKVNGADVTFQGTWKFTPNEHKVTYEYVSGTEGKELPAELKAKAPKDVTGKVKGDTVTSQAPTGDDATFRDETNKGTWTFKSFDKDSVTITNQDEKVTGTWEFTPDPDKYNVKHEFVSATEGKDLPQAVKDLTPKDKPDNEDGSTVTPTAPVQTEVVDTENDGTWTFEGFKDQDKETPEVDAKVNGADVTFQGTWKFTPNEHKVTYEYVSGTEGKELPAELKAKAPKDVTGKVKGDTVTSQAPTGDDATFRDETNKGTWTFKSFDKDSVTITNQDEKVTGTWEFTPDPEPGKYNVTHKFVSKDPNKELPQEVLDQLPANQTGKVKGDVVTPIEPTTKTVEVKDGTWKFVSYDKTKDTIDNKDVEFTGTWEFTPKTTPTDYNVNHKFVSATEGKDLPQAVKDLTPKDKPDNEDGSTVTPTAPTQTEVVDTENDGTWTFEGYKDQNPDTTDVDAKVNGADVTFEGSWKFTPNEHKVTYEYVSGTEGKELPAELKAKAPDEVTGKVKGDTVTSPVPTGDDATFRDDVNKGTWTFKSYDKNEVEITNQNETVKGTWEFTPDPEPGKYNVTHKFVSKDPNKELPQEVLDLLPANQTGKVKGDVVTPTEPTTTTVNVEDGTWTFVSYDKDSKTVEDKDVEFTGTWEFTPKTTPTEVVTEYVDEDGKTIAPKENGTQPNKDIEGYEFVRTEKDDKGNTKHIYKKKTTPPITGIVTKYVDEAGNPLALEEKGKQDKKDIPAYEYVKTYTDKDGNTVHVYRLKQNPTPSVETRYVDQNGNQLLPPKEGANDPENIDGYTLINTRTDENGNTIHTYSKNPTAGVETRFIDTDGNQILADKAGTHDPSIINGYEFVETKEDENGNTTHIYRKLPTPPTTEVVTKFLDENGNELASPLKGRNSSKEIPGFEILRTETDSNGNIIYVYRKKASESQKVTKYVDENGNEISESTKGDNPKKHIDGYEFVRTTTDKDGNTVHIYKRKTSTPTTEVVTEFVDQDGNTIAPKENGTQPNKDIDGYEFVETKTDDKGNTKHIYKKKTTTPTTEVVTKYVDENGNEISESTKGDNPKKNIDGYEFVKTTTDKDGNTVHIYKKKTTTPTTEVVTKYVDENGNPIATTENGTKDKKDIAGYEFVRTETDEKGNTKHIYKKIVTPPADVVTEYVDENGNPIATTENGTKDKKDIAGYEFVRTETDEKGNTKHIYKKIVTPPADVVTEYVDENGNPIATTENGTKDKKDIAGYEFVRTETDEKGNTKHIYKKIVTPPADVVTEYVDENGNPIATTENGTKDKKDIAGYEFVRTETDEKGNTKHIYKKIVTPPADVVTEYVDENGNPIATTENGTKDKKDIAGYEFVRTETDEKGNTKHIYKKIVTPPADVVTEYVDENGNPIATTENGTKDKKDIAGYEFVRTETDEKGNTKHIYKKKTTSPTTEVVTEYVDENGNTISPKVNGKQTNKDIDGYEFVRTETDEKGNTKHIYKKKTTSPTTDVVTEYVDENGNTISPKVNGKQTNKDIDGYEFVRTETDEKGNTKHIYKKKTTSPTTDVVTEYVDENSNEISKSTNGDNPKTGITGLNDVVLALMGSAIALRKIRKYK